MWQLLNATRLLANLGVTRHPSFARGMHQRLQLGRGIDIAIDRSLQCLVQNGYEHLSSKLSPSSRVPEHNLYDQPGPEPGPGPSLTQRRTLLGLPRSSSSWIVLAADLIIRPRAIALSSTPGH